MYVQWVDPGWMPGAHKNLFMTPSAQLDRGEKIKQKPHGSRKGQGEITHQLLSGAEQIELGEISLVYHQSNHSRIMRNKTQF